VQLSSSLGLDGAKHFGTIVSILPENPGGQSPARGVVVPSDDPVYFWATQYLIATRESTLETPNHQGPNRKFDMATHQLWVTPIYPRITQNVPKTLQSWTGRWCGRRDSDPGRWLSSLQRMEGHWTLRYVLDQVIRMFSVRSRRYHALDYGRGRRPTASNRGNYAFAGSVNLSVHG